MDMQSVSDAIEFWKVVEVCMVELYSVGRERARAEVLRVQGKLTEAAIRQNVVYHSEPLYIASDLAGVIKVSSEIEAAYERLLHQFNKPRTADVAFPKTVERHVSAVGNVVKKRSLQR